MHYDILKNLTPKILLPFRINPCNLLAFDAYAFQLNFLWNMENWKGFFLKVYLLPKVEFFKFWEECLEKTLEIP